MGFFDDLKQEVTTAAAELRTVGIRNIKDSALKELNKQRGGQASPVVSNAPTILPAQSSGFDQKYLLYAAGALALFLVLKRRI